MRSYRPSGRAAALVGVLALTLVVAGTTGAVAGKLITSKDIKDGTIRAQDLRNGGVTNAKIAPGAVDWDTSLSAAAKEQIESFVSQGVPGPAGPTGPRGPQGSTGANGMGKIVFWDYFGLNEPDPEEVDEYGYQLAPVNGQELVLDRPGDYLLTMRGISMLTGPDDLGRTAIIAGDPSSINEFDVLFNACTSAGILSAGLPLATCNTSVPISVQPGETLELPIYVTSFLGDACGGDDESEDECLPPLAAAAVTVYQINSSPTGEPSVPCGRSVTKALKGSVHARC